MGFGVSSSVSPTPKNTTFGDMKYDIAAFVGMPEDDDALRLAGIGINKAIKELNTRVWFWSVTYQDITLVASTADYTTASDFKAAFYAEFLDSSGDPTGECKYYTPKEFFQAFPRSTRDGSPVAYTSINHVDTGVLSLNCKASAAFVAANPTLRSRYYRRVQLLVNDSDVLISPSEVELFVEWYAKWILMGVFDPRNAREAEKQKNIIWQKLARDDNEHHNHNWS